MRILILTQKVDINDSVLGFMHDWIVEFAKNCEQVIIISLFVGKYDFSDNVKVLSLGKENGESKIKYVFNFYKYIWRERRNYDAVFVHMNQVYVVLGGLFWKIWRKKIGLWYAHKSISALLKFSEKITDIIFTPSKKSFRLSSRKINIVGHGIDTGTFRPGGCERENGKLKIITVGRISPIKNYETLIEAADILVKNSVDIAIKIIGTPIAEADEIYFVKLKESVNEKKLNDVVNFIGAVPNRSLADHLKYADLFVNMSRTGSLDKAILEAMSCGIIVLSSNEAFREILGERFGELFYQEDDSGGLVDKIIRIKNYSAEKKDNLGMELRRIIKDNHNLSGLIVKIVKKLNE